MNGGDPTARRPGGIRGQLTSPPMIDGPRSIGPVESPGLGGVGYTPKSESSVKTAPMPLLFGVRHQGGIGPDSFSIGAVCPALPPLSFHGRRLMGTSSPGRSLAPRSGDLGKSQWAAITSSPQTSVWIIRHSNAICEKVLDGLGIKVKLGQDLTGVLANVGSSVPR